MQRYLAIVAACALFLLSGNAAKAADWHDYVYADDGFAISAPVPPVLSSHDVATNLGPTQLHLYTSEIDADTAFIISVNHYTGDVDAAASLPAVRDGQVKAVNVAGVQGIDYVFALPDGSGGRVRTFIVGQTMYQILTIWGKDKAVPEDADRYVKSFQLLKK
jgi:hypothetical protein